MEFVIRNNSQYKELIITDNSLSFSTGLLDRKEAVSLVKELISAAEDLLPSEYSDEEKSLCDIRQDLISEK